CLFGGARDPDAVALDDDALVATARRDLERVLGVRARPEHQFVVRHAQGIAQYPPGHLERVGRAEVLAAGRRLVLAGSSYRGVSLNDCVAGGARAAAAAEAL